MRDLIVNNPHEITMIVVGPMTNCAILLRMYEDVAENIKDIRIMGGNHHGKINFIKIMHPQTIKLIFFLN